MNVRSLFFTTFFSIASVVIAPIAQAQTAVLNVSAQTAQGTYESSVYPIQLGNQSVLLSFLQTGDVIQQAWLDDPSRVALSFDGCLANAIFEQGCQTNGAQVIRLVQLPEPIDFGVAFPSGDRIPLTVMTQAGELYQFQLVLGQGRPPYSLIQIMAPPPPTPAQFVSISQEYQQAVLSQLSHGFAVAEAQGLIDPNSEVYGQVRNCIALMQAGTPLEQAMAQSNLPREVIDRLRSLGRASSF